MKDNNLKLMLEIIKYSQIGYKKYKHNFDKLSASYLGQYDKNLTDNLTERGKSHIFFPVMNTRVKRFVAALQSSYFNGKNVVKIKPVNKEDEEKADALQTAFNYHLKRANAFSELTLSFYDIALYGTTINKCFWNKNSGIKFKNIPLSHLYVDPQAQSISDARFVVHKIYIGLNKLYALQKKGIFKKSSEIYKALNQYIEKNKKTSKQVLTLPLYEVYTKFNNKGMDNDAGKEWYVSTVFGETVMLREYVHLKDGIPIFSGKVLPQIVPSYDDDTVMFYGDSPSAALVSMQTEVNIKKNQEIDGISEILSPKLLVSLGAGLDPMDLKKGAGNVIKVNNLNAVQTLPQPNIGVITKNMDALINEIDDAIGLKRNMYSSSSSNKGNSTATGMSIIASEETIRLDAMLRSYNESFFEPIMTYAVELVYKYSNHIKLEKFDREKPFLFEVNVSAGLGAGNSHLQVSSLETTFNMAQKAGDTKLMENILQKMSSLIGVSE